MDTFGTFLDTFGTFLDIFGRFLDIFDRFLDTFGRFLDTFGRFLDTFDIFLVDFRCIVTSDHVFDLEMFKNAVNFCLFRAKKKVGGNMQYFAKTKEQKTTDKQKARKSSFLFRNYSEFYK